MIWFLAAITLGGRGRDLSVGWPTQLINMGVLAPRTIAAGSASVGTADSLALIGTSDVRILAPGAVGTVAIGIRTADSLALIGFSRVERHDTEKILASKK